MKRKDMMLVWTLLMILTMGKKERLCKLKRQELVKHLDFLIKSLNHAFKEKGKVSCFSSIPIVEAKKNIDNEDGEICNINVDKLKIPIAEQRHIRPHGNEIKYLELTYNGSLNLMCLEEDTHDPFSNLYISVMLKPIEQRPNVHLECGYHIDRYSEDDKKDNNEVHPSYHIHYCNNSKFGGEEDGNMAFSMDTPRLSHHPMELFMTLAEVIGTYNKPVLDKLSKDTTFVRLCRLYANRIARPYYEMITKSFSETRTGYIQDLNPYFV